MTSEISYSQGVTRSEGVLSKEGRAGGLASGSGATTCMSEAPPNPCVEALTPSDGVGGGVSEGGAPHGISDLRKGTPESKPVSSGDLR